MAPMPSIETLVAFFGVSVLLALTPGPDNIFVLLQSAQRGWRAGMCVVLGLCLGLVGHTAAVALGLAAVFAASGMAFTVLKVVGAAYVAWLAWGALRAPASGMLTSSLPAAGLAGSKLTWVWKPGKVPVKTSPSYLVANTRIEPVPGACT